MLYNADAIGLFVTARQQSCGKVMFSVMRLSVHWGGFPWDHCIWWYWSLGSDVGLLMTSSKLLIWVPPTHIGNPLPLRCPTPPHPYTTTWPVQTCCSLSNHTSICKRLTFYCNAFLFDCVFVLLCTTRSFSKVCNFVICMSLAGDWHSIEMPSCLYVFLYC